MNIFMNISQQETHPQVLEISFNNVLVGVKEHFKYCGENQVKTRFLQKD